MLYVDDWRKCRITPACAGNRHRARHIARSIRDHPRVCGEQLFRTAKTPCLPGSPPRVRGTAVSSSPTITAARITPACAGNSFHQSHKRGAVQDHPRVCGEQGPAGKQVLRPAGSPPRVRGTVRFLQQRRPFGRITPACAGNSFLQHPPERPSKDHPRVCGEQLGARDSTGKSMGSPPRVRGTVNFRLLQATKIRITPACAGNSCLPFWLNSLP